MHPRRIIRAAVVQRLVGRQTNAGDRVYDGRTIPADVEQLLEEGAVAVVYIRRDWIKAEDYPPTGLGGLVKRTADLIVEGLVTGTVAVDAKADDLAEQFEDALDDLDIPGMPSALIQLAETTIDVDEELQQPTGGVMMRYECTYWREYRREPVDDIDYCGGELRVRPHINGVPYSIEQIPGCDSC